MKNKHALSVISLSVILLAAVLIVAGYFVFLYEHYGTLEKRALFSTAFGGLGAIFTVFAFIGLIFTVRQQQQQIELQQQEIDGTNKAIQVRRAEDTFFKLLEMHSRIVDRLEIAGYEQSGKAMFEGISAFQFVYKKFTDLYQLKTFHQSIEVDPDRLVDCFNEVYAHYGSSFGHYFRSLYNLVKHVDENPSLEKKRLYTNLVRAQITGEELLVMFYNCLTPRGKDLKRLIEKYTLLKHVPEVDKIPEHKSFYRPSAFSKI